MQEDRIRFPSGELEMDGLYCPNRSPRAVAVTHPHPLYGGDMFNPVVEAIVAAYQKHGFGTLRFNFRGTGKSTGTYDEGLGEQDDVVAAVDFLRDQGFDEIHLSGYSFGTWVNAMALQDRLSVRQLTMVSPPVAFMEFKSQIRLPALSAVVTGSEDEIAPPHLIQPMIDEWNRHARFTIIQGADHFFFGFLDDLAATLSESIQVAGNK
ncbi:alpha/beta hydrolase [Desulfosarcina ovata]|uniref:Alpha/beta hydrolase n=2 Tax=Desulfosarcina ovata TaxID=83564 RepID=A0A5K8AFZ9_9BACT|nr:alpha/beta fold hydrolase [Desulfosarcina ovata]BBO84292.1 alpha/beta hydrolase [Desulfosarcina ovata subsp. sediminis]BBO90804.1 alpha/beta hydrolase [Desulfosarcina ovata subsp. ovata]